MFSFNHSPDPFPTPPGSAVVPDCTASYIGLLKSVVLLPSVSRLYPSSGATPPPAGITPVAGLFEGKSGELNSTFVPGRNDTLWDEVRLGLPLWKWGEE